MPDPLPQSTPVAIAPRFTLTGRAAARHIVRDWLGFDGKADHATSDREIDDLLNRLIEPKVSVRK